MSARFGTALPSLACSFIGVLLPGQRGSPWPIMVPVWRHHEAEYRELPSGLIPPGSILRPVDWPALLASNAWCSQPTPHGFCMSIPRTPTKNHQPLTASNCGAAVRSLQKRGMPLGFTIRPRHAPSGISRHVKAGGRERTANPLVRVAYLITCRQLTELLTKYGPAALICLMDCIIRKIQWPRFLN
jgi:hypothetical protein